MIHVIQCGSDRDGPSIFAPGVCMYDALNDFVVNYGKGITHLCHLEITSSARHMLLACDVFEIRP